MTIADVNIQSCPRRATSSSSISSTASSSFRSSASRTRGPKSRKPKPSKASSSPRSSSRRALSWSPPYACATASTSSERALRMHGVSRFSATRRSTIAVRSWIDVHSPISSFTSSSIAIEWIR